MRMYWTKIILGAVAIFVVGYGAVWFARTQVNRTRHLIQSSDPITIPLAFLPFNLDGQRYGTFQGVTVRRKEPDLVDGLDLRVRVSDSASFASLKDCRLTMADRSNFNVSTGFHCLPEAQNDSGLVQFGEVTVSGHGPDITIPLMLDSAVAADIRTRDKGVKIATQGFGQGEGEAARAQTDRIRVEVKARAESMAAEVRKSVPAKPRQPAKPN